MKTTWDVFDVDLVLGQLDQDKEGEEAGGADETMKSLRDDFIGRRNPGANRAGSAAARPENNQAEQPSGKSAKAGLDD